MSLSRKCPGNGDRGCAKFLPNWDVHPLCRDCRSCTQESTCEVCIEWSGTLWSKHQKALDRATVKKAAVSRSLSAEDSRVPGHTTVANNSVRLGDSADAVASQALLEPRSRGPSASCGVRSPTRRSTPHRATSPRRRSKAHTLSSPGTSGTDSDSSGSHSGGFSRSPSAGKGIDREATVAMVVVHVLTSVIDAIGQAIDLHMAVGMTRRIATGIDMIVLLAVLDLAAGLGLTILEDLRLHRLALPFQGFRL